MTVDLAAQNAGQYYANTFVKVNARIEVECRQSVNKLPNTRVFIAAEKWMARSTGVGGLISLQNGNLRS